MENNLGDIIYLILIAVVALSGLFGKKNKQKKDAERKKSIFDELPKSWEEFEEMIDSPQNRTEPERPTVFTPPKPAATVKRDTSPFQTTSPFGSAEAIASPEYETAGFETMSYDSTNDFSKLRIKKQIKESVFSKYSALKVVDLEPATATSYTPIEISLDDAEEARKAFLYSEIFHRKY